MGSGTTRDNRPGLATTRGRTPTVARNLSNVQKHKEHDPGLAGVELAASPHAGAPATKEDKLAPSASAALLLRWHRPPQV